MNPVGVSIARVLKQTSHPYEPVGILASSPRLTPQAATGESNASTYIYNPVGFPNEPVGRYWLKSGCTQKMSRAYARKGASPST